MDILLLRAAQAILDQGTTLFAAGADVSLLRELNLMTTKPFLYVFNADESVLTDDARNDIVRILGLWAEARARFGKGGPFLFGTFSAADIFYAPVVTRFVTYGIGVPGFAQAYMQAIWEHDWMKEWIDAAVDEEWVIEQFEVA